MSESKPYGFTTPCSNCPFRSDIEPYIMPDRVTEIEEGLDRGEFPCHKTTHGRAPVEVHCAGALILLEKLNRPSQMMRISERLGLYDRSKLDMDAPVYEDFEEMYDAHVAAQDKIEARERVAAKKPKKRKRKKP